MSRVQVLGGRSTALRYGAAVGSVAVVLLTVMAFDSGFHDYLSFVTLIAAVTTAAWYGGLGPALLSMAIGFVGVLGIAARSGQTLLTKSGLLAFAAYFLTALPIAFFGHVTQQAREHAVTRQKELQREIEERRKAEGSLSQANAELGQRAAELKAVMEAQGREKRRFERLLDHLPVGVVLLTPHHQVAFANRLFRERFGETAGRPCLEYIQQRVTPRESSESFPALETPAPGWTCLDGTLFQIFSFPFTDPDGDSLILEVGVDVTESRRVRARLSEQAALLQLAHDAILVTDLDDKILFWNHGAEAIYGWQANEAVGGNVHELLRTTSSIPLDEIKPIIQDQGEWEGELTDATRGGGVVIVASRWSLQRDREGKACGVLRINRDITRRRRAEEELRLNQRRLALALKAGRSGTFDWDIQNNIDLWSPEIEQLYGVPPGEFGGRHESWESLLLPEDLESAQAAVQESLRSGELQSEWRVRRPTDGEIRWLSARATVFFDDAGRPSRMVGINVDVTDRKRAEESLRQSRERYHALVWATSQIVWTADPNGMRADSPSWRAFTGQSEDQAKGFGWADALHPEDRERTTDLWSDAVRNRSIFETEYRVRRRDGEFRDLSVRGVPVLHADSSIREWVGACTDITDRKRVQEALAHERSELARSNAELQRFAYMASHDLQEPLRMVANFTELLAQRYGPKLDDDAREFMAYAVGGANRMRAMIKDVLTYSRVGNESRSIEPVDCNESLGRALWNLRASIDERAAMVSHEELPFIRADATELVQIFQNLIGNGIKFNCATPPRVHVSSVRNGGNWVFSVGDNGIGIEPQFADRIFVIFQRLHHSEKYPGTGIGLALCKRIVECRGGKIWVESKPGEGSTFSFSIPESSGDQRDRAS